MKNIFIDLGAYNGDSIKTFLRGDMCEHPQMFEIYAFEPNPKYAPALKDMENSIHMFSFLPAAAWVADGERPFAVDQHENDQGSSLMKSKEIWKMSPVIQVKTIDFPKWITQFRDDNVIVKMDIEGAEFPVLQNMLADGSISIIKKLYVELHPNKVPEYTTQDAEALVKEMSKSTQVIIWR